MKDLFGFDVKVGDLVALALEKDWFEIGIVVQHKPYSNLLKIYYPDGHGQRWISVRRGRSGIIKIGAGMITSFFMNSSTYESKRRKMLQEKFEEFNGPTDWKQTLWDK